MEWKIYIKKVNQDLTLIFLALIVLIAGICVHEMENSYAELEWKGDDKYSVILNGEEEYVHMPNYSVDHERFNFIRNGKNPLLSLLNRDFGICYGGDGIDFIYYYEDFLGENAGGLYIKKGAPEKLFEPTKDNIKKIVISKDWEEVLIITHEDEICFDRFLEKYKKQLEDYSFVLGYGDSALLENTEYDIDIYYAKSEASRLFGHINQKDFNEIRKNYHLSKNAVA